MLPAGIGLVYLISFLMSIFGSGGLPVLNPSNASMLSIGFSLFVVIIASLNLVMDFDFIEEGAASGAPKYMNGMVHLIACNIDMVIS